MMSCPTKNGFFEIYELKIWDQLHKKSGARWVGGWMDRRVDGKAGLRIAYSNQKSKFSQNNQKSANFN